MRAQFAIIAAAVLVLGAVAGAQVPTSPWTSVKIFAHGYVDRSDLDVHLEFPIFNRNTGSRAQVEGKLIYDSNVWYDNNGAWAAEPGGGWRFQANAGAGTISQWQSAMIPCGSWGATYQETSYTYRMEDGTTGPAGSYLVVYGGGLHGDEGCPTEVTGSTFTPVQTWGQSYTVWTNSGDGVGIWDAEGDNELADFYDTHYNSVRSSSGNGTVTYTDPLSSSPVLTVNGSSPVTYSYPGANGGDVTVTETTEIINTSANLGCYTAFTGSDVVPSQLEYPDGETYTFSYTNGRLSSMTLPTGGVIYFSQTESCSGGVISGTLTRSDSVNTGTEWSWTMAGSGGGAVSTTETAPSGDYTDFTFGTVGGTVRDVLNQVRHYLADGAEQSAATITSAWNGSSISGQTSTTELFGAQPLYAVHQTGLDTYGNVTSSSTTDWGTSPSGGPVLRSTAATWSVLGVTAGYADKPANATVYGPSGDVESYTSWAYNSDGDLASITRSTGTTSLTTGFTYNDNGALATVTGPNNAVTTYTYASGVPSCGGFFPTLVQSPYTAVKTSRSWNCAGGVLTSSTDGNGQKSTIAYGDPSGLWRPSQVTQPDGGVTSLSYTPTSQESTMDFNGGLSVNGLDVYLDALGRPYLVKQDEGPANDCYKTVQTQFDAMGRVTAVSEPYTTGEGSCNGQPSAWTQTAYTESGATRIRTITNADNGWVSYADTQNDELITAGPAPTNENVKRKQEQFDGLGRLASVCEVTNAAGSGACGQSQAEIGYLTSYTRNGQGNITRVNQSGLTRSFAFDELGRLTSETNPESGTATYGYDYSSFYNCGSAPGNLLERRDASGDITCYAWDPLNRITSITYPTGPSAADTPTKSFLYGARSVNGVSMLNAVGRLSEAYTGPASSKLTDFGFGYDAEGRGAMVEEQANGGAWYQLSESYYPNGAVESLTVPGNPAITYGVDGMGRTNSVSAAAGQNPVTTAGWGTAGLSYVDYGSGDSDSYECDPAGRMSQYQFTVGSATDTGQVHWNPIGSLGGLQITDLIPGATDNGINCGYKHDDLGRVIEASCGAYDETFAWDAFGNHNSGGTPVGLQTGFTFGNNRISGASYDADGNLLQDPLSPGTANVYDAEGRAVSFWGASVTYGALGREVAATGGTWSPYTVVYAPDGAKLGLMTSGGDMDVDIPLPGGGAAVYGGGVLAYYRHADWLGSAALSTAADGTLRSSNHYTPFGFSETGSGGNGYDSFTGAKQWIDATHTGGQYDFMYREYNPEQGRWWTPDPAGLAAVNPANPQTWNRYAYVGGTPLEAVDPTGLGPIHCLEAARRFAIQGCGGGGGSNPFDSFTLDGAPVDGGLAWDLFDAGDGPGGPGGFGAVSGSVYSCATFASGPTVVGQSGDPELVGTPGQPQCIEPSRDGTYCYQWQMPTLDSLLEPLPGMEFLEFGSGVAETEQFSAGGGGGSAAAGEPKMIGFTGYQWPVEGVSGCAAYPPGGVLNKICANAPTGPWGDSTRGCLLQLYTPGAGYLPFMGLPADDPLPGLVMSHAFCFTAAVFKH